MYCRVCKSELVLVKDIQGEETGRLISLHKCPNCRSYFSRLDFINQNMNELPDDEIDGYLNNENDVKMRISTLFSLLDNDLYDKNNKKYLDIGCGVGWSLLIANEYGFDSYGVEPEIKAVQFAKSRLSLNVVNSYFSSSLFEQEFFDLIVMDQVLEHLPNPLDVLMDAFKCF